MAYTTEPTWVAGNPLAASELNTYVRDNVGFLFARTYYHAKTTQKDVVSTAAKTDLLNAEISILAGELQANGFIDFTASGDYLNNSGSNQTVTLELKLGSQVLWDSAASDAWAASANRHAWSVHIIIQAKGSTSSQGGGGEFIFGDRASATTGSGHLSDAAVGANRLGFAAVDLASTSVDMTSTQTLTFSVTHSASNASLSMRLNRAIAQVCNS